METKQQKLNFWQKVKCTYHGGVARCILEMIGIFGNTHCFNARVLFKIPLYKRRHLFGGNDWYLLLCKFGFAIQPGSCVEDHKEYCENTLRFLKQSEHLIGQRGYSKESYETLLKQCK